MEISPTEPSSKFDWINLSPEPGSFTFGYCDRCPWYPTSRYHLALRIPQQSRLPKPGESAEVGHIHLRWSADGRRLTVDTMHEGERKIYLLDMRAYLLT
ncbi:MAG: hypothetical protein ACP5HS_00930 [Anaerolineae bacterium]